MNPAVSVVMPLYNAQRYLAKAIRSVLAQTFTNFELIAVNDGSTDRTEAILNDFAARDPRIRIISRPNTGIVGALNDGIDAAAAPLIARMDGDDVSLPQRFAKQVKYLEKHRECVLVGSRVLLIDPEGAPIRQWATESTHEEIDNAHLARQWPVVHPSVMMRRDAVLSIGSYRRQYQHLEDLDLFLRLAEIGRLANLPEVLLHYRLHFSSICHTLSHEQAQIRDGIYRETHARRGSAAPPPPDAKPDVKPKTEVHRLWAWWALNSGHVPTARKHALAVLRRVPLSLDSWRLVYCALRGR